MEIIILNQIEFKYIDEADVATNKDILAMGEPIIIKNSTGDTMEMRIGNGVNLIKDLKSATSGELAKYALKTDLKAHTDKTDNPHSVTKKQVGLENVDNTSDENKPVSTAQQNALNLKQDKLPTYVKDKYLHVYEDTSTVTPTLKLEWVSIGSSVSEIGDYIASSKLDAMSKVLTRYGGNYWVLVNHDTNYYQWWRTDVTPKFASFKGMRIFNGLNRVEDVMDKDSSHYYAGYRWSLINSNLTRQFVCEDNTGLPEPGDADYIKQKLYANDYVAVNIEVIATDESYATTSEDVLEQGTMLKYVNTLGNNAYKFSDGVTKVKALTEMTIEDDLIAQEKIYLSKIYEVTDWSILDNAILTGVIQATAVDGTAVEGEGKSFVTMVVINKILDSDIMHTRYLNGGAETSTWELLNPTEAAAGELSQWHRIG